MNSSATIRRLPCVIRHLIPKERFCLTASVNNCSTDVRWLQPAGAGAQRMEDGHQKGVLHFPVCITVNTVEPLRSDHVQKTLEHLYNKIPPLRTCFRYRDGELWFCEMDSRKIDYKEVDGDNLLEEVSALMDHLFTDSHEGPLWRVRFMRGAATERPPKKHPGFPYQSTIITTYHHGMTDGNMSFYITNAIVNLLEKVIAGIPIDDSQIGTIVSDEQTRKVMVEVRQHLENHPDEVDDFARNYLSSDFIPLLYQAFGFPKDPNPTTKYLISRLETSTFHKFQSKCEEAGVSYNAGFVLAINSALVELVREAGVSQEKFNIKSRHGMNLRRYWQKGEFPSFGCHIGRMFQLTEMPPSYCKETFWEQAKTLHVQLQQKLKNKHPLVEDLVREMRNIHLPPMDHNMPLPVDCDYYISNAFLPGRDDPLSHNKHVKVADIHTFIAVHLCEYMIFHLLLSVPGSTSYTLSYSTWHLTDENARFFLSKVETIVEDLAS